MDASCALKDGLVMEVNGRCKSGGKGELKATDVLKEDICVLWCKGRWVG